MGRLNFDMIQDRFPSVWRGGHLHLQCGDGWLSVIEELSSKINDALATEEYAHTKILRVKEKQGKLSIDIKILHATKELCNRIQALVGEAKERSAQTCVKCGSVEKVETTRVCSECNDHFLRTLCEECRAH